MTIAAGGPVQEDDVLLAMADHLRSVDWVILACGGNQIARYRFSVPNGRRKSPDLVCWRDRHLLVTEVKVRQADLFRPGLDGFSDVTTMTWLSTNVDTQLALLREAKQALANFGLDVSPEDSAVQAAVGFAVASAAQQTPAEIAELHQDMKARILRTRPECIALPLDD